VTGALEHNTLPTIIMDKVVCNAAYRPNTSANWAHAGMKVAEQRLNAETIQFSWES
jgi:hypothetical protein